MSTWCNNVIYWSFFSSTCFGYIRPSSGALDVELQHMVFCTEFLDGWWSWEPLRRSCVRCGWCRTSRTAQTKPDTRPTQRLSRPPPIQKLGAQNHMLQLNISCSWWWAYVPETCRTKETLINYIVASSWQFTLFHDEDARSNNPQIITSIVLSPKFQTYS